MKLKLKLILLCQVALLMTCCIAGKEGDEPRKGTKSVAEDSKSRSEKTVTKQIKGNDGKANLQPSTLPDWSESAVTGGHIWVETMKPGELCCAKKGKVFQCSACRAIAHFDCIPKLNFTCRQTFCGDDAQQQTIKHHWVQRRMETGECKACGEWYEETIYTRIGFGSSDNMAVYCAWCKSSYHAKKSCFDATKKKEGCSLGTFANIIVPPTWIMKHQNKKTSDKKKSVEKTSPLFEVKPVPSATITPVVVFINPQSGGNQGAKLLEEFQWQLNPRQVFDLKPGIGPKFGLELYRNVPNLRILVCGGDGTAGWVLSVLDQLKLKSQPAVGVLPLGTGNDLARVLNWGGGYTDEPIENILTEIGESDIVRLDRWSLKATENSRAKDDEGGKSELPPNMKVVNNYFSIGVDADIALEFHEARNKDKDSFNSVFQNKLFYTLAATNQMMTPKWKDLFQMITIDCDGRDLTPKLKEHQIHAVLFLNIPSYGGGTHPWDNSATEHKLQAMDDKLIEVIGLTTSQLALVQMRDGSGTCIAQCRKAKIVTSKTIPIQVDGEPLKLKPSIIQLDFLNTGLMLAKKKRDEFDVPSEPILFEVFKVNAQDYSFHRDDKDTLKTLAILLTTITLSPESKLENVRETLTTHCEANRNIPKLLSDWCFLDACQTGEFYRVDRHQEDQLLYKVTECNDGKVYILNEGSER